MTIYPDHKDLQYSGRIDFENPKEPVIIYAASYVKIRFTGTSIRLIAKNRKACYHNILGFWIDGEQGKVELISSGEKKTYVLAEDMPEGTHELMLFKRMDAAHYLIFCGFELDDESKILPLEPLPNRRIEVFGDSVSCGEVSEAVEYVGKPDPENHEGIYSNSWYSYSWMTARKLGAELHDTSQGGISLFDGTGWFAAPQFLGVESCYDKLEYHPDLGPVKNWDFKLYHPQVVIVAIGQNDNHPEDYMLKDYNSEKSEHWRKHYQMFIERLMELYAGTQIILTTTILGHEACWDQAIDEVCKRINSKRVHHFLYQKNGCGTPGHIRIPEAEEMAEELTNYIESLGKDIWNC